MVIKRILKIGAIGLLTALGINFSYSQNLSNASVGQIKSPQVREIERQGLIPVNLQVGQISPTIPLYELKTNEITIPILLKYANDGLKIGEYPTWTGLGWNVFAGGVISQNVKGLSDLSPNGMASSSASESLVRFLSNQMDQFERTMYQYDVVNFLNDSERDIFTFNFLNHTGMFYFDGGDSILQFHRSDLKIEYNKQSDKFTITDDSGFKYQFDIKEVSSVSDGDITSNYPVSVNGYSWYLSKIITPNNDEIVFTYVDDFSYGESVPYSTLVFGASSNGSGCSINNGYNNLNFGSGYVMTGQKLLSSITTRNGKVYFNSSPFREDLILVGPNQKGKVLSSLVVEDNIGTIIKNVHFKYGHFQSANSSSHNRLKLKSLNIYGSNLTADSLIYDFTYYAENMGFPPLGSLSKDYDHWGYYNGAGNTYEIPSFDGANITGTSGFYNGANKNANSNYSKFGMLKTINNSTGGVIEFEYEPNKVDLSGLTSMPIFFITNTPSDFEVGGNRVKKITYYNQPGSISNIQEFLYSTETSLKHYPNYLSTKEYRMEVGALAYNTCGTTYIISNKPQNSMPGSHIEYLYVSEKNSSTADNGYSKTFFLPTDNTGSSSQPFPTIINSSWRANIVSSKEDYRKLSNGSFEKVAQENHSYYGYLSGPMLLKGTSVKMSYSTTGAMNTNALGYSLGIYTYFTEDFKKTGTSQTTYDGTTNLTSGTLFFYESAKHIKATRIETQLSNAKNRKEKYFYSFDFDNVADSAISYLKQKNINVLLRNDRLVDTFLTESKINIIDSVGKVKRTMISNLQQPVSYPTTYSSSINLQGISYDTLSNRLYDSYGNIIQEDRRNEVSSYFWNHKSTVPVAVITNSDISSCSYSSFEGDGKGNWDFISGGIDFSYGGITGGAAFDLNRGNINRTGLLSGFAYIITYWKNDAAGGSVNLGGTILTSKNGWTLYQATVTGISSLTISGSAVIDELRLYPVNAQMTTYTYNPLIGITSQCDVNNRVTYYEYDVFARLLRIRDMDYNILKTFEYKYKEAQ